LPSASLDTSASFAAYSSFCQTSTETPAFCDALNAWSPASATLFSDASSAPTESADDGRPSSPPSFEKMESVIETCF
jgi:hypothetical protein